MSSTLAINNNINNNINQSNSTNEENENVTVASRKQAAAELRRARKAAREPRSRLFSDTSDELPKGILKHARNPPTKRSVSECVDDLSQIMADLNLNLYDLPKGKLCLRHQYLNEEDEHDQQDEENEEEDEEEEDEDEEETSSDSNKGGQVNGKGLGRKKCDCNKIGDNNNNKNNNDYEADGDDSGDQEKPKKSVRFNDKVYETVFYASKLYDRRNFVKYHLSTRHHPPQNNHGNNNNNNKSKKKNRQPRQRSKSESDDELQQYGSVAKSSDSQNNCGCKQSKSQRSRQSKKDRKRKLLDELNKRENQASTKDGSPTNSCDDQGYHSHSFSD